jgi:hypothetical protein
MLAQLAGEVPLQNSLQSSQVLKDTLQRGGIGVNPSVGVEIRRQEEAQSGFDLSQKSSGVGHANLNKAG